LGTWLERASFMQTREGAPNKGKKNGGKKNNRTPKRGEWRTKRDILKDGNAKKKKVRCTDR